MAVTSAFSTITSSIAALPISGVTIKDTDEIPQSANMILPVMFPRPNDFVTDFSQEFVSFGSNTGAKINFEYTLNYVFLFVEVGGAISTFDIYGGLMQKLSAILVAFASNDAIAGLVDLQTSSIQMGTLEGPNGQQYWGILFGLKVLEHAQ